MALVRGMETNLIPLHPPPPNLSTILSYSTHFFNSASDAAASSEILYLPIRQQSVIYQKTCKKHQFHVISCSKMTYHEPTHLGSVLGVHQDSPKQTIPNHASKNYTFILIFPYMVTSIFISVMLPKALIPKAAAMQK